MDGTSGNYKQVFDSRPGGILRVDINKPRRSSGSSVEFRQPDRLGLDLTDGYGPSSPQPSIDRLSVTWADAEDTSSRVNSFTPGTPPATKMEVRFPDDEGSEDEDYSASVSAIMQRRVSTRRSRRGAGRGRRASSPFSGESAPLAGSRRRSSAYTTSSGETAISIEDGQDVTQEQIYENIRLHKEVLGSVKQQPWGMRRKLRLVGQAKAYIKKHEGALQERLAQNKCTRDILARFNILLARKLQRIKREAANLSNWMIPWELRIKEIESHFGSVVASYFTFLRWLFWVNLVISVVLVVFVVVPEILTADPDAGERKQMLDEEKINSYSLRTLWEFEGILKYSPIFYGYYNIRKPDKKGGYHIPMAYLMTGIAVYIYSFVATLRKMAENSRMSKLSEKEDECIFSWKLFTGWDYMIGNAETAHNKTASIILSFKEALLEEAEKKKDLRNWKIIFKRVIVNACIMVLLCVSAYAVVEVVGRSKMPGAESNLWRQNEITIVMSLISFIFPIFFELLGLFESYHPRRQLRIQLARIMVLNLLNLYSLIFALFDKISDMTKELRELNPDINSTAQPLSAISHTSTNPIQAITELPTIITTTPYAVTEPFYTENVTHCYEVYVNCPTTTVIKNVTATLMTIIFANGTSISPPYNQNGTFAQNFTNDFFTLSPIIEEFTTWKDDLNFSDFNASLYEWQSSSEKTTVMQRFPETTTISYDYINYTDDDEFDYRYAEEDSTYDENYTNLKNDDVPITLNYDKNDASSSLKEYLTPLPNIINENNNYDMTIDYNNITDDEPLTEEDYIGPENLQDKSCFITKCVQVLINKTKIDKDDSEVILDDYNMPKFSALIDPLYKYKNSYSKMLNRTIKIKLRNLCWETMFGQELVKLTMMDLVLTILATLFMDFFRAVFVRFMNKCWCWDLEKTFPQYGDFKIAENILHLVNNQGMVWMGMFFSPGLVVLNLVKLIILMYLRSWAVMTCNVPHEVVFRASRSNNFYLALLITMLFLCVLPVGYAIVWVEPSWHCGPFSNYQRIYHLFTQSLQGILSPTLRKALDYIASPGIVIPLLVLLILIIYYLLSLTGSLREANNDLKIQLRRERTEERRKMFQIADKRNRGDSNELENTPFGKWKKILPVIPTKSEDNQEGQNANDKAQEKKDSLVKIVKLALRKSSGTSDDESCLPLPTVDDETDTEFHESLPEDILTSKDIQFTNRTKQNENLTKTKVHKISDTNGKKKHHKHTINNKHKTKSEHEKKERRKHDQFIPEHEEETHEVISENVKDEKKTKKNIHITFPYNTNLKEENTEDEKNKKDKQNNDTNTGQQIDVNSKDTPEQHYPNISQSFSISLDKQDDSITSLIPVITISKTESCEDVLNKKENNENTNSTISTNSPGKSSKCDDSQDTKQVDDKIDNVKSPNKNKKTKYRTDLIKALRKAGKDLQNKEEEK